MLLHGQALASYGTSSSYGHWFCKFLLWSFNKPGDSNEFLLSYLNLVKYVSRSSFKTPNYFGHFYFPIIVSEVHFNAFIVLGLADSWTTLCVLEIPISSRGNINDPP